MSKPVTLGPPTIGPISGVSWSNPGGKRASWRVRFLEKLSLAGEAVGGVFTGASYRDSLYCKPQAEAERNTEASALTIAKYPREIDLFRCRKFVPVSEPKLRSAPSFPCGNRLRSTMHAATAPNCAQKTLRDFDQSRRIAAWIDNVVIKRIFNASAAGSKQKDLGTGPPSSHVCCNV